MNYYVLMSYSVTVTCLERLGQRRNRRLRRILLYILLNLSVKTQFGMVIKLDKAVNHCYNTRFHECPGVSRTEMFNLLNIVTKPESLCFFVSITLNLISRCK